VGCLCAPSQALVRLVIDGVALSLLTFCPTGSFCPPVLLYILSPEVYMSGERGEEMSRRLMGRKIGRGEEGGGSITRLTRS
jgi:hypothetical protein